MSCWISNHCIRKDSAAMVIFVCLVESHLHLLPEVYKLLHFYEGCRRKGCKTFFNYTSDQCTWFIRSVCILQTWSWAEHLQAWHSVHLPLLFKECQCSLYFPMLTSLRCWTTTSRLLTALYLFVVIVCFILIQNIKGKIFANTFLKLSLFSALCQ